MILRRKLLITLLAGLTGLLLAEITVRVGHLGILPPLEPIGNMSVITKDPILRVENMSHGWLHLEFKDRFGKVQRTVDMRTNSMGLRGPEVEREKAPGAFRIACLGDSQTFGHGVNDGDDYPRVLEGALRAAQPASSIEVLNFGVGGYDTEQETLLLQRKGLDFQPDLVLLGFFLNDTALTNTHLPVDESTSGWWIHFLAPGRPGAMSWLREHTRLLDVSCDWLFRRLVMRRCVVQRGPLFADDFDGWIKVKQILRDTRDLMKARSGRFAVMLVPLLMDEGGELLSDPPYRKVAAFCREEGIPCFDPAPIFHGRDVDSMRVHPRDVHSNAEAQGMIGKALAQWLLAQGLVPTPATGAAPPAPK